MTSGEITSSDLIIDCVTYSEKLVMDQNYNSKSKFKSFVGCFTERSSSTLSISRSLLKIFKYYPYRSPYSY